MIVWVGGGKKEGKVGEREGEEGKEKRRSRRQEMEERKRREGRGRGKGKGSVWTSFSQHYKPSPVFSSLHVSSVTSPWTMLAKSFCTVVACTAF